MKRTLYILSLTALLLVATILGKVEFLAYNRDIMFFTMPELMQVLWHGLPLDISTVAMAVLPVWFITLLTMKWPSMPLRWIVGPYISIVTFLMGCVTGATIIMYENWKFLLDASIFSYMSSPGNATASASVYYIITRIGLILLSSISLSFLAVIITPKSIERKGERRKGKGERGNWHTPSALRARPPILEGQRKRKSHRSSQSKHFSVFRFPFSVHMLSGLLLCLMAWGINGRRADERSAFHSEKILLNHAAVNPVGHMIRSMLTYSKEFEEQFRLMPEDECDSIFAKIFPANTEDITDTLLRTKRPDILTIQLESMGAPFIESLGGAKDVAPELCQWMTRGVNFTNAWATSFRTDRGTVSALSGYVSYPTTSLMMTDSCLPLLPSLAKTLKGYGYSADYMYSGNSNHMNKRKYMEAVGFRMWDIEDIDVAPEERDVWGANDSIAMNRMLGLIQRTKQENGAEKPFFWACQTISSHEPWEVPYHRLDNKVHNAFAYTDHCVGQFLDSLSRTPAWDNLLVVVYADHGHTYGLTLDEPEFFHMPLFFVGGAVSKVKTYDTIIAQNDIVATILSQMEIPHNEEFPWSRNVFSRNYTYPFAYCNYPAGALFVDGIGKTMIDVHSGYIMTDEPEASTTRLKNLQVMLQHSYNTIPQEKQ
ncbi:MAG: LTA synthase family protein [Bacteroidaceae bacterium]|nr:LTA synthase family protein [Bacteroidaceae bacterium]